MQTCKGGFTLLEVMLVVVLILLAVGVSMPSFVRSYQSAKLRTSARTVVMAHRYTRGMAVLQQQDFAIYFDREKGRLDIVSLRPDKPSDPLDTADTGLGEQSTAPVSYQVEQEMEKLLEDGVRIGELDWDLPEQENGQIFWVNYYPSGTCDPYTLVLEDQGGRSIQLEVDHLSGAVKVEKP